MRYLNGTIFSSGSGSKEFSDNYDRIFGKGTSKMGEPVALSAICGECAEERVVYENPSGPIAICSTCWAKAKK